MGLKIYLDGKLVNEDEARISVFDHGLLYGDGVFEGIRAYNGRVFKLDEHLHRLYDSARAIMLKIPLDKKETKKAVLMTLRANGLSNAYIRLVVTRGKGDLGLDPKKCPKPTVFIITHKITLYPRELYYKGMEVITVPTIRNLVSAIDPQIKSLNYLNNILAKIEANLAGMQEAIMLNKDGYVVECTGDNIFIVRDGVLFTPPTWLGVLSGITRNTVLELAIKLKIKTKEEVFTRYALYTADECFLTGTAAEIIPVVKIDDRVIGEGMPGKITLRLMKEFRVLTKKEGIPI
ncbi:branched-chain-amino-acid transaminase [Candidatus Desantisbacteria bacterium CG1_02_38_46]|uniref:Branched-chain-amino-acid aminotransferase n=3 Tax=unclassified Candidatus Desantisiibacteriota TaxID=3106372 RepID=A0A2H9PAN6_9BACT|nr:MAG: branched-chain-amino-acid transaminase [Candidatus Desantisbacteria bacterium CG1_02_38_46]PIU51421.1 MAG: branched-chain-amino-acid transaminase [Candidatus Desantisbacteria bacterium CG07_land_8_20_14_0_80_39_15]PIZ15543.1 MAG: branched-chain-amino-acid transaminase [Candidatus Desantisbacteria bacterium CG_4_10_14_0_8_um_filter_39_17]